MKFYAIAVLAASAVFAAPVPSPADTAEDSAVTAPLDGIVCRLILDEPEYATNCCT